MIIPVGFAQVAHFFTGLGLPLGGAITYGVSNSGAVSAADLAENLHDAYGDTVLVTQTTSVSLRTTRVKLGPNATGPFAEFTDVRPGSDAGTAAAPNLAYLVEKRTALGGRAGSGRMYIPGVDEGDVDGGGLISAARVTASTTQLNAWLARLILENTPPYLLHNSGLAPTAIDSLTIDPVAATQRRRMRR